MKMNILGMKKKIGRVLETILTVGITALMLAGCTMADRTDVKQIKIGVTLYDQYDTFLSELMEDFNQDLTKDVTTEVYNASQSQKTQNEQVSKMIEDGCRVICVNLVDRTDPTTIIDLGRKNNVPIIFFNRELVEEDLQRWSGLYYVGADAFQSGILQGELAAVACNADPSIDKNGDGMIQYIVLEGEAGHQDAIVRTEYSVNTLIDAGVKVDKMGYAIANWNRAQAQTKVTQMIEQKGENIELVLANNDDMALGAIDAYKAAGTPRSKWPAIFGIDGTKVGLDAVQSGEMLGTVYNDRAGQAISMFRLAYALATGGKTDNLGLEDGKYIRLPYAKVTSANVGDYLDRQ
ncbi:MAG: galactose ABC transporter substrate-binding protein [Butyrivibrio sp.]|jgi:methyl-galactoside transport system substrate-binding protein|nr:galactose ABC transporter substrate-binding protein [Butyrivibrio sp.]